jgi:hypothetical protein
MTEGQLCHLWQHRACCEGQRTEGNGLPAPLAEPHVSLEGFEI